MLREARLLEMHDVLPSAGRCAHQDHSVNDRRSVLGHLLRDHTAERETENVAALDTEPIEEGQRMLGHLGHGLWCFTTRAADPGVVEKDQLTSVGKRISDRWVPVVERAGEML